MLNSSSPPETTDSHSYFVPMVDMLAGVVFILIIMLASVSLVSREDFSTAVESQAEIKRIQAELEKARLLDARYLDPRRIAEAALKLLLNRLQDGLARRGFESESRPEEGRLIVTSEPRMASVPASRQNGAAVADALAGVLAAELPCLAEGGHPAPESCAAYPAARLDTVAIVFRSYEEKDETDATPATRLALSLFADVARATPDLLALRAPGGARLITYRGLSARQTPSSEHPEASSGQIEVHFQMDVPPLPK
jgi:hypothetical protein